MPEGVSGLRGMCRTAALKSSVLTGTGEPVDWTAWRSTLHGEPFFSRLVHGAQGDCSIFARLGRENWGYPRGRLLGRGPSRNHPCSMCGITGAVWSRPDKRIEQEVLRRMVEVLAHRGPDGAGTYTTELGAEPGATGATGVALGHRRLAIIDLAGGHQPMANEDQTVWIVFNGEIYNFRDLRRHLEGRGHRFQTRSDTETIIHLYEDEGLDFAARLNGMFALAIWDARRRQLVLARDRLGEKPLVYREEPGRLLFASELKSLLEVPGVPRELDPASLDAYLAYQYVPHPRTIFRGIAKLPPAHLAVYRGGKLEVRPYWQPDFQSEKPRPLREAAAELRELLTSSVGMRMESDVPLGAFLSGGIDSTIVVGLMQKLSRQPVRTFSIGFPVAEYDETRYAAEAARRFGTCHREFRVEPNAVEILPQLVWHYDEPFADSSAVPTWYLSRVTREHVTVALTGDGGDELFAGYPRYAAVWLGRHFDWLPRWLRAWLAGPFWRKLPSSPRQKSLLHRWRRFTEMLGKPPLERYLEWIAIFNAVRRGQLYAPEFLARLPEEDPLEFLAARAALCSRRDPVTAISLVDLTTYLPCDLMVKVDIASMAHGLECRPPFLDHRVVEWAAGLPLKWKFRFGRGKRILRKTFADLLPEAIQNRSKMGFGVPLDHWFRGPLAGLAREVLLDSKSLQRGLFRAEAVRNLIEEHVAGRFNHAYRLWALLVLELWQQRWL
jgi:asparagine synthase (glutamine-hydrolysing)